MKTKRISDGDKIRAYRKARGLSQAQVADGLGISQVAWSRVERGEMGLRPERIALAASLLGIEAHALESALEANRLRRVAEGGRRASD